MPPGFGISLVINVDTEAVKKNTLASFELGMIDAGRELRGDAFNAAQRNAFAVSRGGRTYRTWRTGNLARSLGIAVSPMGNSFFGPLHRMDGETVGGQGIPGASRKGPQVALATSAGYGLYVHEGTSRVPARPFLLGAIFAKDPGTLIAEKAAARMRSVDAS